MQEIAHEVFNLGVMRFQGKVPSIQEMDFRVRQGETTIRCVAWGMADRMEELMSAGGDCCIACTPKINEWQGRRSVELEVTDFQAGPTAKLE